MRASFRLALGIVAGGVLFGCNSPGSVAAFPGVKTPVMLGPKDRIGGDGQALATTPDKEFESEANWSMVQQNYTNAVTGQGTTTISSEWTGAGKLGADVQEATGNREDVDLRLTDVMPASYGVFSGMKMKAYVSVEGNVVKVQPKKGDK